MVKTWIVVFIMNFRITSDTQTQFLEYEHRWSRQTKFADDDNERWERVTPISNNNKVSRTSWSYLQRTEKKNIFIVKNNTSLVRIGYDKLIALDKLYGSAAGSDSHALIVIMLCRVEKWAGEFFSQ